MKYRVRPLTLGNQTVHFVHHVSDLVRLQALLLKGGVYLDADMVITRLLRFDITMGLVDNSTDMVITRPIDSLLHFDITLGLVDNSTGMGNAFIAAKRNSDFIREWYSHYNDFTKESFYKNSLQVPRDMWHRDPKRLHMESARLYNPNWYDADKLFKRGDFDWSDNYAIHVWTNGNPVPQSESDIQTTNTTIAQIFRYVLYGDKRPRLKLK